MSKTLFSLGLVMLFASTGFAAIEKGNSELSIALSVDGSIEETSFSFGGSKFERSTKTSQLSVAFSYGYFISPVSEIGGSLFLIRNSITNLDDEDLDPPDAGFGQINVFYAYHFVMQDPRTAPYIGAEIGKGITLGWDPDVMGSEAPKISSFGLFLGLKYFISEKTSLGPVIRRRFQSVTIEADDITIIGTRSGTALLFQINTMF